MTILDDTISLNSLPQDLHDMYIFNNIMTYMPIIFNQLLLHLTDLTTIIMTTAIILDMNGRKMNA
jgi:hypothetical protein